VRRATGQLLLEALQQTQRLAVLRLGEAPQRDTRLRRMQLQGADTRMVEEAQAPARRERPRAPGGSAAAAVEQTPVREHEPTLSEVQVGTQVNL